MSVHQKGPTEGFLKKIGLTGHPLFEKNAFRTKCFCLWGHDTTGDNYFFLSVCKSYSESAVAISNGKYFY